MDQAQELRNLVKKNEIIKPRARVITVTSGKGGVGKSNISLNLAVNFAKKGKKVVILDADFGLANIEIMLGVRPQYNLADLMFLGKSINDILIEGPYNVNFISGGSGIQELTNLTKEQIYYLIQKLNELDSLVDIIIIDTGAGIADSVIDFILVSEEVILVTTPEPTSITDSYSLLKTLSRRENFSTKDTSIKVITNKVNSTKDGLELFKKISTVAEKFLNINVDYLGRIPEDPNVSMSVISQKPATVLYPNSPFSKALERIAIDLFEESGEVNKNKGVAYLFANLLRKVR